MHAIKQNNEHDLLFAYCTTNSTGKLVTRMTAYRYKARKTTTIHPLKPSHPSWTINTRST